MVKPMLSTPRCGDREKTEVPTWRLCFYYLQQLLLSLYFFFFFADHINLLRGREVNAVLSHDNFIFRECTELEREEKGEPVSNPCAVYIYIYIYISDVRMS